VPNKDFQGPTSFSSNLRPWFSNI